MDLYGACVASRVIDVLRSVAPQWNIRVLGVGEKSVT